MTDTTDKIQAFFAKYPTQSFKKGEIIIHASEEPEGIFYIIEGRVNQYDIATNGNAVVVNSYKSGAFFPMSWAINKVINSYFFEAATNIVARRAPARDAVDFLHANPAITFDLLSRVYMGTDGLLRRVAHIVGGDAKSRLRFELLNAAYRFGQRQSDNSVVIPLNEEELGRHAGMARETVSRHIQSLKNDGLVEVTRQGIIVYDLVRLEDELGGDL